MRRVTGAWRHKPFTCRQFSQEAASPGPRGLVSCVWRHNPQPHRPVRFASLSVARRRLPLCPRAQSGRRRMPGRWPLGGSHSWASDVASVSLGTLLGCRCRNLRQGRPAAVVSAENRSVPKCQHSELPHQVSSGPGSSPARGAPGGAPCVPAPVSAPLAEGIRVYSGTSAVGLGLRGGAM